MVSSRQEGPVRPVPVPSDDTDNRGGYGAPIGYDNRGLQLDGDTPGGSTVAINLEDSDTVSQGDPVKAAPPNGNGHGALTPATEDDPAGNKGTGFTQLVANYRTKSVSILKHHWPLIRKLILAVLLVLYHIYLIYGTYRAAVSEEGVHFCNGVGFLIVVTALAYVLVLYYLVLKPAWIHISATPAGQDFYEKRWKPAARLLDTIWANKWVRLATFLLVLVAILIYLVIDSEHERSRLVSAFGVCVLVLIAWLCSAHIDRIVWRHVLWGLALQLVFGVLILRVKIGQQIFKCIGCKVDAFLAYTDEGSKFVFGFLVADESLFVFAFEVLPVIIFFGFSIQILYYYGIMQVVIMKIGWLLQVTVGTTACESLNAAANIFIGQTEAPLLVKPYITRLTKSEIHAIMTGGFATIAGSVLAAYIKLGVPASHLLSASVMSAPAALAVSKLVYPETERSVTTASDIKIEKGDEVNALDAASRGAIAVVKMCGYIAASLIAFIAFVAFINGVLGWMGELVGFSEVFGRQLSFELLASLVFRPVAWLMGVPWSECGYVGELVALKTILNEFVAYGKLSELVRAGVLSQRSRTIATYALCGFSNLGAIGIQISGLSAMAPERRSDFARLAVSAMVAGNIACFLTACVAGALINDSSLVQATLAVTVNGTSCNQW